MTVNDLAARIQVLEDIEAIKQLKATYCYLCDAGLADLLDLAPPGTTAAPLSRAEECTGEIQFHFTGPSGREWHVVAEQGAVSWRPGVVDDRAATVTVSAAD